MKLVSAKATLNHSNRVEDDVEFQNQVSLIQGFQPT